MINLVGSAETSHFSMPVWINIIDIKKTDNQSNGLLVCSPFQRDGFEFEFEFEFDLKAKGKIDKEVNNYLMVQICY